MIRKTLQSYDFFAGLTNFSYFCGQFLCSVLKKRPQEGGLYTIIRNKNGETIRIQTGRQQTAN